MITVYRASAGSGKTHRLTGDYLRMLFTSPLAYRKILAVTFTNKATDEMKTRIIKELHLLASGAESGYLKDLSRKMDTSDEQIRKTAKERLIAILHDYAAFNISTIDKFFQQTMRAFTREIGLQSGYGIEMDQSLVLTETVDNLLGDLDSPEHKDLLQWLLRFAEEKVENAENFNLQRDIVNLAGELFKESYKILRDQADSKIYDKQTLQDYKDELLQVVRTTEKTVKELGEKGLAIMQQHGLSPDMFKGGKNSPMVTFVRLANINLKEPSNTFLGLAGNVDGFYKKSDPPDVVAAITAAFDDGLNDCVLAVINLFQNLTPYYTAKEIIRYYYILGILNDISQQVALWREDKNMILINDTTELLNKVIDGSDTPFVYEKTGTHIDHYMIDEFQDTSQMQWNNFRPLVKESLAYNHRNLIVGDVKQSIYRFRNSDWELLNNQLAKEFRPEELNEQTLQENWRSCRHIVEINNALFALIPQLLQSNYNGVLNESSLSEEQQALYESNICQAYEHSYQEIAKPFTEKDGHVKFSFFESDDELDWKEKVLDELPATLERLQDDHFELCDIAILVRTNNEGAQVANKLLAYKNEHPDSRYRYDIISNDALLVSSSKAVRFLIGMLRYLMQPENAMNTSLAQASYALMLEEATKGERGQRALGQPFPPEIQKQLYHLARQPLYEAAEGLLRLFSDLFGAHEQVFIQAFLDLLFEYTTHETADFESFLKWWDESGYKKNISSPDSQNAIRILTIHKAKGLGIKAVILPFCDWAIDHRTLNNVIVWCQPQTPPFNKLALIPVRYGAKLAKTIFAEDYFKEKLYAYIDSLNTLYVGLTRAKEELIVYCKKPKQTDKASNSISGLLWDAFDFPSETTDRAGRPLISLSEAFDRDGGTLELGAGWQTTTPEKEQQATEIVMGPVRSISPEKRLHLRLHREGGFVENANRKYGLLMHDILGSIETGKDIPNAIEQYVAEGIISSEETAGLEEKLHTCLQHPMVAGWYDGSARVLNEVDILFGAGESRRPDRIMFKEGQATIVDYKFGEKQDKRYLTQVRSYIRLVQEIGYKQVKGYLWYVELGEILEVT